MENDERLRQQFSKILGAPNKKKGMYDAKDEQSVYTWEEIFNEIGKLQERASQPPREIEGWMPGPALPLMPNTNPNLHYHGTIPCYNNFCVWG